MQNVATYTNKYIRCYIWYFCRTKMAILETREVAGVENANACNFDHKHSSPKDVTGNIAPEFNSIHLLLFMKIYYLKQYIESLKEQIRNIHFNFVHSALQILFCIKHSWFTSTTMFSYLNVCILIF